MTQASAKNVFPGSLHWGGRAHRQAMPLNIPGGPRRDEEAGVLAFRWRSGRTTVTVTWKVEHQVNLSSTSFDYDSPRAALDAGWELGERYENDARYMERMARIYV
jgi:hypothetical protein